jgi:hypothetical protein
MKTIFSDEDRIYIIGFDGRKLFAQRISFPARKIVQRFGDVYTWERGSWVDRAVRDGLEWNRSALAVIIPQAIQQHIITNYPTEHDY